MWIGIQSGDNGIEEPPVPIPNTEVKLYSADDTWWEAAWESRTLPVFKGHTIVCPFFVFRQSRRGFQLFAYAHRKALNR